MLYWIGHNAFKWLARFSALFAGSLTLEHVLHEQLGYRTSLGTIMTLGLITILVVRVWMPWSPLKSAPESSPDCHTSVTDEL